MLLRRLCCITLSIVSLSLLNGCQFTAEQQAEFDPEKAALARLKLGLGYLSQAQADVSGEDIKLAHYNLALANQYSPNNPNVMLGMALFDQHVGEYREAETIYQNITKMEPHNGLYVNHYGSFLCATNRYNEAKKQFQKAISFNKPQWKMSGLEQLGYCAIQNNDLNQANNAFKQLFKYDSSARHKVAKSADLYRQQGAVNIANYLTNILK